MNTYILHMNVCCEARVDKLGGSIKMLPSDKPTKPSCVPSLLSLSTLPYLLFQKEHDRTFFLILVQWRIFSCIRGNIIKYIVWYIKLRDSIKISYSLIILFNL